MLKHPEIFSISDDHEDPNASYPISQNILYFLLEVNGVPAGVAIAIYRTLTYADCHVSVLKEFRGGAVELLRAESEKWVRDNTGIKKFICGIPEYNKSALRRTILSGWKMEGVNAKSFLKDGKLWDQVMFGKEI